MADTQDGEKPSDSAKGRIKRLTIAQNELKKIKIMLMIIIVAISVLTASLAYENMSSQKSGVYATTFDSGYEIHGLKGEKIMTPASWKIEKGDLLHIHILASPEVTPQRLDDIHDVIFSNDTVKINGQIYYKGWEGAMKSITLEEKNIIP